MWFWRSRERFSMAELMYLNDRLQRTTVVTDSNKFFYGEAGDGNFCSHSEEQQEDNHRSSAVVANAEHHDSKYSQRTCHITISMRLDRNTASFFIKTNNEEVVSFPLYTEAIKFFHHEESMVRIAVRTITLSVYNVDDECIRMFVTNPPVVDYFSDLIIFLRKQSFALDCLVAEVSKSPDSGQMQGRLEGAIAEIGDLLYYCNDIINSGVSALRPIMTKHIMNILVLPLLLPSLRPVEICAITPADEHISTLTSLYFFLRLLHIVDHKALVNSIGASLLRTDQAVPLDNRQLQNSECSPDQLGEAGSLVREAGAERDDSTGVSSSSEALDGRKTLLSYLLCNDDKLVMASLCLSVSFLQNEALDESLLDALGILPRRKRHKKLLLQQLIGDKSDKEVDRLFSPSLDRPHDDFTSDHWENHLGDELLSGSVTLKHRGQRVLERYGSPDAKSPEKLPQTGIRDHAKIAAPYMLNSSLWLVDFPGGNGSEHYADMWKQYTALSTSAILFLDFMGDVKKKQVKMYHELKENLGAETKLDVVFNNVDQKFTLRNEEDFTSDYFEDQRARNQTKLGCDEDAIHFSCVDPDPPERLMGVLIF